MGRWLTRDFVCEGCGLRFDVLLHVESGANPAETWPCDCGAVGHYAPAFGAAFKVAIPMGTRRFDDIRTARKLDKAAKAAARKGDRKEVTKIKREKEKLKGS